MRWWAQQLVKRPVAWVIVAVTLLLSAVAGLCAIAVGQDDDVLAFLPHDNPEVRQFYAINERFGGLDVAIVGIRAGDAFEAGFLERLRRLTRALDEEPSIAYALSLANVEDFTPDEKQGGIRADYLVSALPKDEAQKAALRRRVMSLEHVVGNLVSGDGQSVIIYNFGAHGTDPRELAAAVRRLVDGAFPDLPKLWGGAPFTSTYIYDVTQSDMRRLLPWAVGVILVILVLSFRDLVGTLLALLSTGLAIAMTYGAMGALRVNANIVLSSMPVILFAVGSAYPIHVLIRYYSLRVQHDCREAMTLALEQIGPPVLGAGLTTVAGLASFVAMDIRPMREFGAFTGLGVLGALVLSLTFVPAVVLLVGLGGRTFGQSVFRNALVRVTTAAGRHRRAVVATVAVLGVAGAALVGRVQARMENAAFFSPDSPPDRAERFLREQFGGSQFIQIAVDGDMNDPDVLRELGRVADEVAVLPHVSSVMHIGQPLAMVYEAMVAERRLPPTGAQARVLYRFLQGRASVRQLVTDDRQHALLQVKVDSDEHDVVEALLAAVEVLIRDRTVRSYRMVGRPSASAGAEPAATSAAGEPKLGAADRALVSERVRQAVGARLRAHFRAHGVEPPAAEVLAKELGAAPAPADPEAVRRRVARFLASDESILEPEQRPWAQAIAAAVVALGPQPTGEGLAGAIAQAIARPVDDDLVDDLGLTLMTALQESWRQQASSARTERLLEALGARVPEGERGKRFREGVAGALLDLDRPAGLLPTAGQADGRLDYAVSGAPVLYRGLARSVTANQFKSLASSLALVLVILVVLFRSVTGGLLASAPTVLTLLVAYGLMGLIGLNLDIGTSMLASMVVGAGVDFAVHLMSAWRAEDGEDLVSAARRASEHSGPAIWTNALMVAAGFFVLTLGEARPLKNVGGLTATAMIAAAVATFVAVPALARRRRYTRAQAQ